MIPGLGRAQCSGEPAVQAVLGGVGILTQVPHRYGLSFEASVLRLNHQRVSEHLDVGLHGSISRELDAVERRSTLVERRIRVGRLPTTCRLAIGNLILLRTV